LTPPRAEIPGVLGRICTSVRQRLEATADTRTGRAFDASVAAADPRGTAFAAALASSPGSAVIAECKRTSPSKGRLCEDYDPVAIATAYAAGGAAAISVLTEPEFFEGDLAHLRAVRHAVETPVLRKSLLEEADGHGLAALVEVHDERELDRAIAAGATIIGVNNRDLRSLETDPTTAERLAPRIPPEAIAVCESGLRTPEDLARFSTLGYRGFLVGETLMRSDDPAAALRRLRGEVP